MDSTVYYMWSGMSSSQDGTVQSTHSVHSEDPPCPDSCQDLDLPDASAAALLRHQGDILVGAEPEAVTQSEYNRLMSGRHTGLDGLSTYVNHSPLRSWLLQGSKVSSCGQTTGCACQRSEESELFTHTHAILSFWL